MSGIVNGGKQNLEQRQLAQAMQEHGRQTPRPANLEGIADLERFSREMITFKQATERKLEELSRFKASAEEQLDSLQKAMRELKVATEQGIEELRWTVQRQIEEHIELREKLEQKDEQEEAAGEEPEMQLVEDLQDSTVHKRPLLKKIRGFFRSKSLKKKKKKKKKKKRGLYEQSDLPGNEEEETSTQQRDVRRHDEFTESRASFAESKTSGSYGRREDSNKSSRVSFEIALPPHISHSGSSLAIHYSFNEESEVFEEVRDSPIKIDKHPKSQTAQEGSKVKFKCRGQGKSTKLWYQWFKDGESLPNKNAPILVLDPVQLRDFGYYMCNVSYQDSSGEGSKSSLAKLNVTPDSETRLKRLADVDYNIIEKVCVLLQTKKSVLGGWREVAAAYGLERYRIDDLGNSNEPGKSVMEFVTGTRPNLTVYDFCKELKENPIKRLDVVNILEDHFLV